MLEHGGRLRQAARQWGIPLADWLDLSTGINPWAYPVPGIPISAWQRLPEEEDGLEAAARAYYGAKHVLAVGGSQAAIQTLPKLLPPGRAAVLAPSYAEHAAAWVKAEWAVTPFAPARLEEVAKDHNVVVVVNPNNPTGEHITVRRLRAAARALAKRGGLLVVDEAFADADPRDSLADLAGTKAAPNLVVLRSLGKFFGLAGARVGFAIARPELLEALADAIGPWAVSGPARVAAAAALNDRAWQAEMARDLATASQRLETLLQITLGASTGTPLFRWLPHPRADWVHDELARRGILVRLFLEVDGSSSLRFGLPGDEAEWQRLEAALDALRKDL
jgi:cobalamin biosynthetic protein CobC